jgi:uncharacterized membrane protein
MSTAPKTIAEYLDQLRAELKGADPALVQDALYDAEEYLRSELAAHPRDSEAEQLAKIVSSYGRPSEVADIYRDTEVTVTRALRAPPPRPTESTLGRFFGVVKDPRAYAGLFYMLLSLLTGIFYFTWAVTGVALSAGLSLTIIGVFFFLLFMATVRVLSLVEGRIVETMLGERMPRRPMHPGSTGWLQRIGQVLTDPRTWSTLLYQVIMLPLGIIYFVLAVVPLAVGVALAAMPILTVFGIGELRLGDVPAIELGYLGMAPLVAVLAMLGVFLLFGLLHLARGVARMHGGIAKALLVKSSE